MKIKYAVAASLLLSVGAYAQKEELKALKKLDEKKQPTQADITEYKRLIGEAEPKMAAATNEQKAEYNYYKGTYYAFVEMKVSPTPAAMKQSFDTAMTSLDQVIELEKSGKKKYTEEIQKEVYPELKTGAITMGQKLSEQKLYKEAAWAYAAAYRVDPKDHAILYNAAAMAVNGQDWDNALNYYLDLDKTGFTGEGTSFTAKNKATGAVEGFPNKSTRDIAVKSGQYIQPQDEKTPSVKGEIVKNIALIYGMKGETEKAKAAFASARKANPNDVNLIVSEAELYLKQKDMVKYKELISQAVQKSPNDAVLFFNLGVVTQDTDVAEAMTYYKKANEIDPKYVDPLINLGVLSLKDEQKIVDQMNKVTGTTAKDNARYDALKKQRDDLYVKALPYFEKAHQVAPDNQDVISMLANVYQAMERLSDAKAMKAKLKK